MIKDDVEGVGMVLTEEVFGDFVKESFQAQYKEHPVCVVFGSPPQEVLKAVREMRLGDLDKLGWSLSLLRSNTYAFTLKEKDEKDKHRERD